MKRYTVKYYYPQNKGNFECEALNVPEARALRDAHHAQHNITDISDSDIRVETWDGERL